MPQRFCGREFSSAEVSIIQEVVTTCGGISRKELAYTVCELLNWKRANGKLKERECRDFLEQLEHREVLKLPGKKSTGSSAPRKRVDTGGPEWPWSRLTGSVGSYAPLVVTSVETPEHRRLFQDLVSRYHYLGYAMPFGARLQYLVYAGVSREVVGCIQFSSPAWRLKVRDQWIGWDDAVRGRHLQHVVNNSRFLFSPESKIWPAVYCRPYCPACARIGKRTMVSIPGWSRHWWTGDDIMAGVIGPRTGSFWEKPAVAAGWIDAGSVSAPM